MNRIARLAPTLAGLALCANAWAYEDREMAAGSVRPDADDMAWSIHQIDPSGWPRSLTTELRLRWSRLDDAASASNVWAVSHGTLDTLNHGLLTVDVAVSASAWSRLAPTPGSSRASLSLTQRALPMADGWLATSGLGLIQPGHLELIGQQFRFGVPTRTVLGAATTWSQAARGWQWSASSGTPAALDPIGQAGYIDLGGRASVVGLAVESSRRVWRYAAEAADYRSGQRSVVPSSGLAGDAGAAPDPSGQTLVQALRYEGDNRAIQINALTSRSAGSSDEWRTGLWIDASWLDGAVEHRAGVNDLPTDQRWLGTAVPSGARGAYYRWRWRTRQTLAEFQVDTQQYSGSANVGASRYEQLWANGRYQLDQARALGLQASASRVGGNGSVALLGFHETAISDTSLRALASWRSQRDQPSQIQIGGDVSTVVQSVQLNASALALSDGIKHGSDLALSAAQTLGERVSFVVALRRFDAIDAASAGSSINATLTYRLTSAWSLSGALTDSHGARTLRPIGITTSPPPPDAFVSYTPRVRFALLTLRHEWQAGSSSTPLGAAAGSAAGAGRIEGTVFLDANGNGRRDPGESLVSNVVVILDGRYSVRTDAQGRYEFPLVATGSHRLRILPDNVPLPWSVLDMNERSVEVQPRSTVSSNFGAVRN